MEIKTLMGYTPKEVYQLMAFPLPPECYRSTPGRVGLTDISPVVRDVVLNMVFGPCGLGWSFDYDQIEVTEGQTAKGKTIYKAVLHKLELKVCWVVKELMTWSAGISSPASNDNPTGPGYAAKGAVTNAISGAVKRLGWQQMVYQGGKLNEKVAAKVYEKYGPHPFEQEILNAAVGSFRKLAEPEEQLLDSGEATKEETPVVEEETGPVLASEEQKVRIRELTLSICPTATNDVAVDKVTGGRGFAPLDRIKAADADVLVERMEAAVQKAKPTDKAGHWAEAEGVEAAFYQAMQEKHNLSIGQVLKVIDAADAANSVSSLRHTALSRPMCWKAVEVAARKKGKKSKAE